MDFFIHNILNIYFFTTFLISLLNVHNLDISEFIYDILEKEKKLIKKNDLTIRNFS